MHNNNIYVIYIIELIKNDENCPVITVFVTIYNFSQFSDSATQDRMSRQYRVIHMFFKYYFDLLLTLYVH